MEKGDHDALLKIINPLMTDDLTKVHSFCKQCLHKDLVFINWQLMSALASLERFGEEDIVFINWRSCRHCLQNEWPLRSISKRTYTVKEKKMLHHPYNFFKSWFQFFFSNLMYNEKKERLGLTKILKNIDFLY